MNPELPDIILIFIGRKGLYLYGAQLVDGKWQFSPSEMPVNEYDGFIEDATTHEGYTLEASHQSRFAGEPVKPAILYRGVTLETATAAVDTLHQAIRDELTKRSQ